jgi:hypothetical protein
MMLPGCVEGEKREAAQATEVSLRRVCGSDQAETIGLSFRRWHDLGAELHSAVGQVSGEQVHGRGADEAGDEQVVGASRTGRAGCRPAGAAVLEHRDAVAHGHGLGLVVGDVDRGDAEAALQRSDLRAGLDAELGVEVRQRLVHEEDLRLTDDRAAHRDTLTLTAGERLRLAVR